MVANYLFFIILACTYIKMAGTDDGLCHDIVVIVRD